MESRKAADEAAPPRWPKAIIVAVVVACCCLALGLGLGCGLTGKDCLVHKAPAPPAPLGIPPGGSAFVAASMSLGGYTAATFDPPASTAFVAAVTTTLGVPNSTMYVLQNSTTVASRRLLQAFLVSFVITAPNGSAADVVAAGLNNLPASATFSTALSTTFAAAKKLEPTNIKLVSRPQITVGVPAPPVYKWSPPVRRVVCVVVACSAAR